MSLSSRKHAAELIEHYRSINWQGPDADWYEKSFLETAEKDNIHEKIGVYTVLIAALIQKVRSADPATGLEAIETMDAEIAEMQEQDRQDRGSLYSVVQDHQREQP